MVTHGIRYGTQQDSSANVHNKISKKKLLGYFVYTVIEVVRLLCVSQTQCRL